MIDLSGNYVTATPLNKDDLKQGKKQGSVRYINVWKVGMDYFEVICDIAAHEVDNRLYTIGSTNFPKLHNYKFLHKNLQGEFFFCNFGVERTM